jgi:hypothetical protein
MPKIKVKTTTAAGRVPSNGSLHRGELAVNLTDQKAYIGDGSGNPIKVIGTMAHQDRDNVTITGGSINGANLSASNITASQLIASGESLYYDEGTRADLYTSNWNNSTTRQMNDFGGLGNVTAHGFSSGPVSYTLTLGSLPTHTHVRYEVIWHMVDSLDNEWNYLYMTNNAGSEITYAQWTKPFAPPENVTTYNGCTFSWKGSLYYSYAPWGGSNRILENNGANGYAKIDTGWQSHTANSISVRHYMGANQAASDEACYLSHVRLHLRGESGTITSIDTSVSNSNTSLPTANAVNNYINSNLGNGLVKNVYTYTGNSTYNKSGSDVKRLRVICVGGGGGGAGWGESGGAGGYAERILDATPISSVSITVGGGGSGGGYFGYRPGGGTSSFGSYVSAGGGQGANNPGAHIGGRGGVGYAGNVNSYGGGGTGHAMGRNNQSNSAMGISGTSFFGGGRASHHSSSRPGDHGANGGGGSASVGRSGGSGSTGRTGIVIVYELR